MTTGALKQIAKELSVLLSPLLLAAESEVGLSTLLERLGVVQREDRPGLLTALADIAALQTEIEALLGESELSFETFQAALDVSKRAFASVTALAEPTGVGEELQDLGHELANLLIASWLQSRAPRARTVLALLGLLEPAAVGGSVQTVNGEVVKSPFHHDRLRLERLPDLIGDPAGYLRALYGSPLQTDADAAAMADALFRPFAEVLRTLDVRFRYGVSPGDEPLLGDAAPLMSKALIIYADDPFVGDAESGVVLSLSPASQGDLGLVASLFGILTFTRQIDAWLVESKIAGEIDAIAWGRHGLTLATNASVANVEAILTASLPAPEEGPAAVIGPSDGSRIEIGAAKLAIGAQLSETAPSLMLSADLSEVAFVLAAPSDDGFLSSLLGSGARAKFDAGLVWSNSGGLTLRGAGGLETDVEVGVSIGGVKLKQIRLGLLPKDDAIVAELSGVLSAKLGPIQATVERVGIEAQLSFPGSGGNLHTSDLAIGFKPPSAIGISVDGGGFSGGGYLYIDPAGGEYAGAIELQFQDRINVKAVGVLDVKIPDGPRYALTLVISAEFTPIQLSFGFTLNGVGGLIGVNRAALKEQLRLALRDGSLSSVLFPKDVIGNAPRIISDLKRHFPASQGTHLIGPMAKIGWGSIAVLDLGLVLELPRRTVLILGVLRVAAPTEEEAILNLQLNFVGDIDFSKKQLSIDATLYDSRFMSYTLTGDMAVRIYWGEDGNILATVGGFHPAYTPPPMGLPALKRLSLAIFQGNPRLTAEAYFAVTSNTYQFGAKIELYYGFSPFSLRGFLNVDALIQPIPFRFIAEVAGAVEIRSGESVLFAIRLELMLEGPGPWRARGRGSFEIGFIVTVTISASFDQEFGEALRQAVRTVSVAPLIEAALRDTSNWVPVLSGPARRHVTMRTLGPEAGLVIPPMGALALRQRVAPLNMPLQRIGPARVEGAAQFSLVNVTLGGTVVNAPPVLLDRFAAAQFLDLSDDEKLSRRSFEPFDAGVEIAGAATPLAPGVQRGVDVAYEVIYIRKPRRRNLLLTLRDTLMAHFVGMSAAAKSKASPTPNTPSAIGAPKVTLPAESFVVVGVYDLKPHASGLSFASETAASLAMQKMVANDARLTGKLQVVNAFEAAA